MKTKIVPTKKKTIFKTKKFLIPAGIFLVVLLYLGYNATKWAIAEQKIRNDCYDRVISDSRMWADQALLITYRPYQNCIATRGKYAGW